MPKKKSNAGRKRIEIDFSEFEKLCGMQCTLIEISEWFKVSPDTIERRVKEHYKKNFADIYKKYSAKGKMSLRRNQFALSKTNAAMAIWLGKQYLEQRDKIDTDITSGGDKIRSIAPHQFVATQTEKKDGDNNDRQSSK